MRTWMLAVSIVCGILLYLPFIFLASTAEYEEDVFKVIKMVQPVLIFTMLFITFCKTSIRRLHVQKWHVLLLAIQVGLFASIAMLILLLNPHSHCHSLAARDVEVNAFQHFQRAKRLVYVVGLYHVS